MPARDQRRQRIDMEWLERRDCPAAVAIAGNQAISEAAGPAVLTVRLAAPDSKPVVVGYSLSGEASYGRDYRLAMAGQALPSPWSTLTFRPGETAKVITVTPLNDLAREQTERLAVTLAPIRNAHVTNGTATVTLLDDDNYTAWIGGPTRVAPGQPAEFTVRLSSPATQPEVIEITTEAVSASATTDFRPFTRLPLVFSRGETAKSFRVPVLANESSETDETFLIRAVPRSPGFPSIAPRMVSIAGNGAAPPPSLSVAAASVVEGNAGGTSAWFTVSLSAPSADLVTVRYGTSDGTATTADNDYTAVAAGQVTFLPGETVKTVSVTVRGDTKPEADEQFALMLSNPVNATLATATAQGTIRDDDTGPPPPPQAAWTIMVFMTGDDLNTFARDDINEMEEFLSTLPANPGVNIVVSWDQPLYGFNPSYPTGNGAQPPWRTYGRSVLQADTSATIASSFDVSFGERNTGDPAVLVDFMHWAIQKAPAANYMLQLWGHGSGLEGSNSDNESGGDPLTIDEVGAALGAAGVPALKVVSYDNCLMGMAEVGFAVSQRFNGHFVASEALIPGTGQDYRTAYSALATNPAATTSASIGAGMVSSFQTQYMGDPEKRDTFSAVATGGYPRLISALSQFVQATVPLSPADRTTLRVLAMATPNFDPDFCDLGSFMTLVAATASLSPSVRASATAVNSALLAMVSTKTADARSSSGIGIYLPTDSTSRYLPTYGSLATAFCQATGWDAFARWMATGSRTATAAAFAPVQQSVNPPGTRGFAEPPALFAAIQWAAYGSDALATADTRGRVRSISRMR